MQQRSIGNDQVTYVWLIEPRFLWISGSVFKKVLWIPDFFPHIWGKFLNPLSHVRLIMIFTHESLQDALRSGCKRMNRYRITITEPKRDRGVQLAPGSPLFVYDNSCRWVVWHSHASF